MLGCRYYSFRNVLAILDIGTGGDRAVSPSWLQPRGGSGGVGSWLWNVGFEARMGILEEWVIVE